MKTGAALKSYGGYAPPQYEQLGIMGKVKVMYPPGDEDDFVTQMRKISVFNNATYADVRHFFGIPCSGAAENEYADLWNFVNVPGAKDFHDPEYDNVEEYERTRTIVCSEIFKAVQNWDVEVSFDMKKEFLSVSKEDRRRLIKHNRMERNDFKFFLMAALPMRKNDPRLHVHYGNLIDDNEPFINVCWADRKKFDHENNDDIVDDDDDVADNRDFGIDAQNLCTFERWEEFEQEEVEIVEEKRTQKKRKEREE